jgi:hypothetical protein
MYKIIFKKVLRIKQSDRGFFNKSMFVYYVYEINWMQRSIKIK